MARGLWQVQIFGPTWPRAMIFLSRKSPVALTVEFTGRSRLRMTSDEDWRPSGPMERDFDSTTRKGRYRPKNVRCLVYKELDDGSGRRCRGRRRRGAQVAMIARVARRGAGWGLVGCRVSVSVAMADDRKWVERGSDRACRRSAPRCGMQ